MRGVTSHLPASLSLSAAPLLHFSPRRRAYVRVPLCHPSPLIRREKNRRRGLDQRTGGVTRHEGKKKTPDRMNNSFVNMASIGEFDPLNASIPATKVEITVSCR